MIACCLLLKQYSIVLKGTEARPTILQQYRCPETKALFSTLAECKKSCAASITRQQSLGISVEREIERERERVPETGSRRWSARPRGIIIYSMYEVAIYGCSMNKLVLKQSSVAMQWQQEQGGSISGRPEP